MAFSIINKNNYGIKSFTCDEAADIASLPTEGLSAGSKAFVIATSDTYMLNNNNQWIKISQHTTVDNIPTIYDGGVIE